MNTDVVNILKSKSGTYAESRNSPEKGFCCLERRTCVLNQPLGHTHTHTPPESKFDPAYTKLSAQPYKISLCILFKL